MTPFGKAIRKLRVDLGVSGGKMADRIGVSKAFMSAVELGHKPIPPTLIGKIAKAYSLTSEQIGELKEAEAKSQKLVRLEASSDLQSRLIYGLAKRLDTLPDEALEDMIKVMEKSKEKIK